MTAAQVNLVLLVGLSVGAIAGIVLLALHLGPTTDHPVTPRRWVVCRRCDRTLRIGNVPEETRTYCEECIAAALKSSTARKAA